MYITGYYAGTPTIKDQYGNSIGSLPTSTGFVSAFVSKFDSTGTYMYSRIVDSPEGGQGYGVACDSSGNMYITGFYQGTPTIKDQYGNSIGSLPESSDIAAFVSKFNSTGTYQYSRIVDSIGGDQGQSVACDSSGNVYITGFYQGTPTIKDQYGNSIGSLPTSTGVFSAFVSKFDSTGTYQYSRIVDSPGGQGYGLVYGVACDSSGNMYITGYYSGTPTIKDQYGNSLETLPASSGSASFVSKFNSSGTYQYSRIVDSTGGDQGQSVACDSSGNMYITGYYEGTPTIKDQYGNSLGTLPDSTGGTAFVCKFTGASA